MSKVIGCRTLIPVGVVLDTDGETFTVPTLYDAQADEVFVINRRDHDVREDVVKAVKAFVQSNQLNVGEAVDASTWENIRVLTGLAKPPAQEI